jgi:effector-binding domain-containing protein
VSERVPVRDIPSRFGANLDRVWRFVRDSGFATNHNVFVYHWEDGEPPLIEFGVQVDRAFDGNGDIVCSQTPAGMVATATHVGPYDRLGTTHEAVQQWCRDNGYATAATNWEVYGDWDDDPAKLETVVFQLLRT